MRRLLNNPKIVLPAALIVAVILSIRFEYLDVDRIKGYFAAKESLNFDFTLETEVIPENRLSVCTKVLSRDRWLRRNWQELSSMQRDLFVTDVSLEAVSLAEITLDFGVDSESEVETIELTEETLQSYIAQNMGLDADGFFVRFGVIRKREGDDLKMKDGNRLSLGKIIVPEVIELNESVSLDVIDAYVADLKLDATSPLERTFEGESPTDMDADANAETEVRFREGDLLNDAIIEQLPSLQRTKFASAVIRGGINPSNIYREGDLISRVPALGLASVSDATVELIDRVGRIWLLELEQ